MQWEVRVIFVLVAVSLKAVYSKPLVDKYAATDIVPSCSNPVYCQGDLLDTVQRAVIFNDSKTFVDMSQINPQQVTLDNFRQLLVNTNNNPSKEEVAQFVTDNFISESETVTWTPPDFNSDPSILSKINDQDVQKFAKELINIWPVLGRQLSPDVATNPDQHSILQIPNGFIVPGGRFRELYYWDSYWIIKGLLISEMYETVRGMLDNFCHIIDQYGFMPNGARLYYLNRSHPPLFTLMVKLYYDATGNVKWLTNNVGYIEKELTFWLTNKTVNFESNGIKYQLAHYGPASNTPRPESYREDLKTCSFFKEEDQQRQCYQSLKAGAESGWDFSSRWFFDKNGGTNTNLTDIDVQRVIPVDLNSFLCRAFRELAGFYKILGNDEKYIQWLEKSDTWKKSIDMVFYNEDDGIWYDYDSQLQTQRKYFYPSNFAPLWAEIYDEDRGDELGLNAAAYFVREGVPRYQGGIPTSLVESGEQWDFKNAWPPLQEIVILGLLKTKNKEATDIAKTFASRWVLANKKGFNENQIMFEKYDAVDPGKFGGGGEYVVQAGFGWTNGVALSLIDQFFTDKNQ